MTDYEQFILARWAYAVGEPIISDVEYTSLEKQMKVERPTDEYVLRSWSLDPQPTELLEKYGMQYLKRNIVLSYNAESIPALTTWEELEEEFGTLNERSRLSFKIDGWHMNANYYNGRYISGNTRGRTGNRQEANVVEAIVPKIVNLQGKVMISGEGSIPNDKWSMYALKTGNTNQRSSVSTVIANEDSDYFSILAFAIDCENGLPPDVDRYELLHSLGFSTPYFIWVNNYEQLVRGIDLMSKRSKHYNYLTDGLVIENSHTQLAIRLGEWEETVLKSYVTDYEQKPGMYGVSMVIRMHPVTVRESKRTQVSITNLQQIINNNLQIGAPIAFNVRSSANAVIDVTNTRRLQKQWAGHYEEYRNMIDKESM